ncbi:MAG: VWA domain-containing protein [Acidobacteria bacterium]|nr:VWA domain-containing protein [Acidobacteriota bacterium]
MEWRRTFRRAFWSRQVRTLCGGLLLGCVLGGGASVLGGSQEAQPPGSTGSTPVSEPAGSQEPRIRVEVKEVQIPFTVFDRKENLVLDLKKEDLQVFEDGVEQEILYFTAPTNLPLRFGILIDTSSSTRPRLDFEKEAAMQLGYYVLGHSQDHQGFLMTFDHTPQVVQDFTTNPDDLTTSIDKLQAGGGTALLDAIIEACEKKLMTSPGPGLPRRVLVLFSDGDDNLSQHSIEQAVDVALRADVRIFAVSTHGYGQSAPGQQILKRLVEETNGQLYTPLNSLPSASYATGYTSKHQLYESQNSVYAPGTGQYTAELHMVLTKALESIGSELTNQYAVGYISTNSNWDGKFRQVEIRTRRKNVEIRTKKGYYAVP